MLKPTMSFGASIQGPLHASEGIPNQDAWLRADGRFGSMIVVCDGLGSKPQARLGARAACQAVREAVTKWYADDLRPVSYLSHLVELFWRLRIHPVEPEEAATTCLLALACRGGSWVVGGIGDGMAVVLENGQHLERVIGDRGDAWGNETLALGMSSGARFWNLMVLSAPVKERVAVLATDGVADDILPEQVGAFCRWLIDDFGPLEPFHRWCRLGSVLRNWPTPKHLDDKTVAVLSLAAGHNGGGV